MSLWDQMDLRLPKRKKALAWLLTDNIIHSVEVTFSFVRSINDFFSQIVLVVLPASLCNISITV